jgi:alpha-1,2-mannosyltransferase
MTLKKRALSRKSERTISASSKEVTSKTPSKSKTSVSTKSTDANVTSSKEVHKEEAAESIPFFAIFAVLSTFRILSAYYYQVFNDPADETYNYWEPTHYMLYNSGFQTWEYSPQYALRSYAYTGIHACVQLLIGAAWGADKITVFYRTRAFLGLFSAFCESYFLTGLARRFGSRTGFYTFFALLSSAGMVHSALSYLPSSFTMYFLMLAWGAWLREGSTWTVIFSTVVAICMGWPFAIVCVVPLALYVLFSRNFFSVLASSILGTGLVLGASVYVDKLYYRKVVLAVWNIIKYNALGQGGDGKGGDLYGTEPASYYFVNLALNFNLLVVLAFGAIALLLVDLVGSWRSRSVNAKKDNRTLVFEAVLLGQLLLWVAFMSSRPHKEERFLYPVYPLVCAAAALCLQRLVRIADLVWASISSAKPASKTALNPLSRLLVISVFVMSGLLSASRTAAVIHGFSAPFSLWEQLGRFAAAHHRLAALGKPVRTWAAEGELRVPPSLQPPAWDAYRNAPGLRVCVGKEWYRFPSSYFLPEYTRSRLIVNPGALYNRQETGPSQLGFLKSGFGGQLPQSYLPWEGTSAPRSNFNDLNREEKDRYVNYLSCDFIVDYKLPTPREEQGGAHYEPWFNKDFFSSRNKCNCNARSDSNEPASSSRSDSNTMWRPAFVKDFLHSESTPTLARAFWIPGYSDKIAVWGKYYVLERVDCDCA